MDFSALFFALIVSLSTVDSAFAFGWAGAFFSALSEDDDFLVGVDVFGDALFCFVLLALGAAVLVFFAVFVVFLGAVYVDALAFLVLAVPLFENSFRTCATSSAVRRLECDFTEKSSFPSLIA